MSRIARAAELAKKVFGTDRGARNKELMQQMRMDRMIPGRAQNLAETVLKTPSPRPGGLVAAGQAMRGVGRRLTAPISPLERGLMAGGIGTGIGLVLSETDPNDLGRSLAKIDQPFYELMGQIQDSASDLAEIPQVYFMQVKQAYDDERQKQKELQNIQEFGDPMGEPVEMPPTIEEQAVKPVSLLMAQGGPANSGRTISNMDRTIAAGMGQAMMSDNEPMMQDRSPANQMFSIDAQIENLMKSYNMLVNAREFDRAQEVVNQIDQLQQQKIGIQAQNDPRVVTAPRDILSEYPIDVLKQSNVRDLLSESGRTISNRDRQIISDLLDSISE